MMNWEAIGAIAETLGAIAVIATLFYLAVQIRQNTLNVEENARRLRLDGENATIATFSRYRALLSQSELATIFVKGTADYAALSDVERVQFGALMDECFFSYANLLTRVRENAFDRARWRAALSGGKALLRKPGAAEWWRRSRKQFPPELIAELEQGND